MKTTKFLLFFTLLVSTLFYSCSDDEPETDGGATSITLTTNKTVFEYGEYVFVTVKTNEGTTVSSSAEVKLNDEVVNYQSQLLTPGTFTVTATFENLRSNEVVITVNEPPIVTSIVLTSNATNLLAGEEFVFTTMATYSNGDVVDKTDDSTYSVNSTNIANNMYSTNIVGGYTVKSTLDGIESNELAIIVEALGPRFQKHAVIEDYTGTWCGWCPRVMYGIEQVEATTNNAIVVAAHIGDVMQNNYSVSLKNSFGITGYPTAYLDRDVTWNSPEPSNVAQVVNYTIDPSRVGISLEAALSGTEVSLEVSTKFGENYSDDLFLTVFVLEDGVVANQDNYTDYYGGVSVITDFSHSHVLRHSLTNVTGDQIPAGQTTKLNTYVKNFTFTMPTVISNSANVSFVAIVTTADKKVVNARSVHIDASNDFEQN